jgi:hypothetical protein
MSAKSAIFVSEFEDIFDSSSVFFHNGQYLWGLNGKNKEGAEIISSVNTLYGLEA